jgi:hypothetical protein
MYVNAFRMYVNAFRMYVNVLKDLEVIDSFGFPFGSVSLIRLFN